LESRARKNSGKKTQNLFARFGGLRAVKESRSMAKNNDCPNGNTQCVPGTDLSCHTCREITAGDTYENRCAAVEAAKKNYTVVVAQIRGARPFEIYADHGQKTEHFVCNGLNQDDATTIVILLNENNHREVEELKEELDLK
jgi:hypothetical protein